MRILVLPNFEVRPLTVDDPSLLPANKYLGKDRYWFFRHLPGVEVDVVDNLAPFPLSAFSSRSKVEVFQALRVLRIRKSYDIILSHSYNSGFVLSMIRSLLSERSPPHFVIDVGCLNGGRRNRLHMAVLRFALKSVSGLVYHSSINESFYSDCVPDVERALILYGDDMDFFKPLETKPTGDYVLSIGHRKRDYETLLEAWRSIDIPLVIVGDPKVDLAGMRNVQIRPRVSILELREMIHSSRFVVLPIEDSPYSVGQMTLTQCMAMGKPIVVTDVPGVSDYVVDGHNCLKVRPGSAEDLVDKVTKLASDDSLRASLSANARKYAVERLSEVRMAREILEFIERTRAAGRRN